MTLLLSALLGLQAAPEAVDRWIAELGAEQSEVRDAAQKKLLEAGTAATKSLTVTAASTKDPEVKARAQTLLQQIADQTEIRLLLDLRTVTLAPGRHTMEEALQALSAAGGPAVTAPADTKERTFDLGWEAVPFGQAVEDLCRAHGGLVARRAPDGSVTLRAGPPARRPFAYAGPLRIEAANLSETRTTDFEEHHTFNASGTLTVSTGDGGAPPFKALVTVTGATLEDGTRLTPPVSAAGGIALRHMAMNGGTSSVFQFTGIPRSAVRLATISGDADVTVPLGSDVVTFTAEDVGKERKVGEYLLTLTRLTDGNASISFKEDLSTAPVEDNRVVMVRTQIVMNGSVVDPRRTAVEQRLDLGGIVGIDESGAEKKLINNWKKLPSNSSVQIVNGRVVEGPLPTIELEGAGTLRQVRFRFKPRSAKLKFPFTMRDVPLP